MNRGAVAEISLTSIAHNLRCIKKVVKNRPVIPVVKADAYGHGAVKVSKTLAEEGVPCVAVAYTGEAIELREAGIDIPIMVLFERKDIKDFFDFGLIPVIHDVDTALSISSEAEKRNTSIKVHVKVDTGMGRAGLSGSKIIKDLLEISEMNGIELVGLLSHFSEADLSERSYAFLQIERFNKIREMLSKKIGRKIFSHMANSAAVLAFEGAHLDAVRPGLMLYGYSPFQKSEGFGELNRDVRSQKLKIECDKSGSIELKPAMKVKTKFLCIRNLPSGSSISYGRTFITNRKSRIGVLPLGYADGYNRLFSNNAEVLVKGKRAPVVGRVCMDLTMTDLTDIKGVTEKDEVVIMGKQGKEIITAYELAYKTNTIPYEILTSLGGKSKKDYV
ncbi:MAG: alanine racemase [Nitrospirae bacterium RBG_13_39_12]|nr:MAG: alanine racemase [Nitrospirae bacterium RBG_13_39_12]